LPRVLRRAPPPPRRGSLGVLRHRSRARGGRRQGRRALPEPRARAVHRALLAEDPGVAGARRERSDGAGLVAGQSATAGRARPGPRGVLSPRLRAAIAEAAHVCVACLRARRSYPWRPFHLALALSETETCRT